MRRNIRLRRGLWRRCWISNAWKKIAEVRKHDAASKLKSRWSWRFMKTVIPDSQRVSTRQVSKKAAAQAQARPLFRQICTPLPRSCFTKSQHSYSSPSPTIIRQQNCPISIAADFPAYPHITPWKPLQSATFLSQGPCTSGRIQLNFGLFHWSLERSTLS